MLKTMKKENTNGPIRYYSLQEIKSLFFQFKNLKINYTDVNFIPINFLGFPFKINKFWRRKIADPLNRLYKKYYVKNRPFYPFAYHYEAIATK